MDTVVTIPQGTYPVTYSGTLDAGEILEIPNRHRRRGDSAENKLVRVVFQNSAYDGGAVLFTWYQYAALQVLDAENSPMSDIYWPNAWQLETDERVKIKAQFMTRGDGDPSPLRFKIVAFYRRPDEG